MKLHPSELSWGCNELLPTMELRPLRVELRLLRIVAHYEFLSVTSWVEAVTKCRPLWNFVRYELSWGCYELSPAMKNRPLRVELRLIRIVAHYKISSVTSWVEAATNWRPLWNFVRYELSWGCYELSPAMKLRPLRVELRLLRIVACYETSSVTSCVEVVTIFRPLWNFVRMSCVEAVTNCRPLWNFVHYELSWGCYERSPSMKLCPLRVELRLLQIVARYETSSVTSWVEAVTNCCPLWNFVRYELRWGCYKKSPSMKLCPLRVELRLLRIVARYETSSVTSWVEAVTNCCLLWNFIRYELRWGCYNFSPAMKLRPNELSWSCYELSPAMKLRPLRVELRLLRIFARYETLSVTSWVEAVTNCRPLWNFVRYELSWGCYKLLPAMKLRPLRVALRLLQFFARYETSSVWVELKLLRIVARYGISYITSWVEAVTKGRPLWNFVRYELSWGCYELLPAMKLRPLRVELRLLRIVAHYETSSATSWDEAVTKSRPLWNFVRYELSWGCYELLPAMKLRLLRVELRLLRIVACYETSSVTSCVEVVTIFRPLWNFVRMSWVEAVTNCRPLWNFVRYELSWGCYVMSPSMKLCPLRVELRLLRIFARYETSSVTSWVEAVTNCCPLWNFVRYELRWGCYKKSPSMKLCPLRVELRLLRIVARYETSSVTSWVEAVTKCCPLWNCVRYELSWGC